MRYTINEFLFDANSLVLTQHGKPVAIRHNEAQLLKLFLENPEKVLSKDQILNQIWQQKVVSEQAVFQNISNLRNVFGNDAIKTYSKRGYQWQLPVERCDTTPTSHSSPPSIVHVRKKKTLLYGVISAAVFLLALLATSLINDDAQRQVALITFSGQNDPSEVQDALNFDFEHIDTITSRQFFATEKLAYQALKPSYPVILTGNITAPGENVLIDFTLVGPNNRWQGQILAPSKARAYQKLNVHLQQDFIFNWVNSSTTPDMKLAQLTLAHQNHPDDLVVLNHLANTYLQLNKYDTAMSLAVKLEQQAQTQQNVQQQGNALLLQSKVLTEKELVELSTHKLDQAIKLFSSIDDHSRLADAYNTMSWLAYLDNNYAQIKQNLLASLEHALTAKDIERELHALTYLSVMAHKFKHQDDKYQYLQEAEAQMNKYQLPQYHYAKIPFHYAIYADNPADKEPHLKQVLIYTELTPHHWVAQSSRSQLVDYYLDTERLTLAQALVDPIDSSTAQNTLLKARVALASQDFDNYETFGKRAFELAQLAGRVELSLDIALLLCNNPKQQINHDFYLDYINQNATTRWSERNREQLHALNLTL